jgi:uncharacterized membrane protein
LPPNVRLNGLIEFIEAGRLMVPDLFPVLVATTVTGAMSSLFIVAVMDPVLNPSERYYIFEATYKRVTNTAACTSTTVIRGAL